MLKKYKNVCGNGYKCLKIYLKYSKNLKKFYEIRGVTRFSNNCTEVKYTIKEKNAKYKFSPPIGIT